MSVRRSSVPSVAQAARSMQAQARGARERARAALGEDQARRLRMRILRHRIDRAKQAVTAVAAGARTATVMRASPSATVRVTGELDMATAPGLAAELERRLHALCPPGAPGAVLTVEVSGLSFVDARGLTVLLEAAAHAEKRGVEFRLAGCPPCLLRLVEITRTHRALCL